MPKVIFDKTRWQAVDPLAGFVGMNTPTIAQARYRFKNNSGTQTSTDWLAALDTAISRANLAPFRLRIGLQETGGATDSRSHVLEYSVNSTVTYNTVTTSSSGVRAVAGTVTDGTATTTQLGGSGTFTAGVVRSNSNAAVAITYPASGRTEIEWTLELHGLSSNDVVRFRVTSIDTQSVTPTVTATVPAPTEKPTLSPGTTGNPHVSLRITWNTVPNATQYEVHRKLTSAGEGAWEQVQIGPVAAHTSNELVPGTSYDFRVRGVNTSGEGPWSDVLALETESAPEPEPPYDFEETAWGQLQAQRQIVRVGSTLYIALHHRPEGQLQGNIALLRSTDDGATWSECDYANRPWDNPGKVDPVFQRVGIVVDGDDDLHLAWLPGGHDHVSYGRFDTGGDQWVTPHQDVPLEGQVGEYTVIDLAVDSNNAPHIVTIGHDDGFGDGWIEYARWNATFEVWESFIVQYTFSVCPNDVAIEIGDDDIPVVVWTVDGDLYAARIYDIENTEIELVASAAFFSAVAGPVISLAIDSTEAAAASGDVWVCYLNPDEEVTLVKHEVEDDWDVWQTPSSSGAIGRSVSVTLHGGEAWVFFIDDPVSAIGDAVYAMYDGTWSSLTVLHTDQMVIRVRGAFRHSPDYGTFGWDYLHQDDVLTAGTTYYGNLSLDPSGTISPHNSSVSVSTTQPTLTQKHTIQPEDSSVSVQTTEATTSVASNVGVDDTSVNVVSTEPTLTQKHVIQPDDSVVSVVTTEAVLAAAGVIGVDDTSVSVSTTEPTLVQSHVIQPDNSSVGVVSTQPNVTPSGTTYTSGSEVVQGTVLQTETVVPDNSIVTVASTEPAITQSHTLQPNNTSVVVVSTEPTLSHKYTVQPDNSSVGVSTEEVSLTQSHTLQPADSQVAVVTEEAELSSAGHIGVNNTSVNVTTTEPSLTQSHTIQPDNSIVEVNTTEAGLTQSHSLQPDNSIVLVEFTQPSIVQAHVLQVDNSIVSVSTTQATISTAGVINPDDSIVAVSSSEAGLTQSHILIPDDSQSQVFTSATTVSASYTISVDNSLVDVSTTQPDLDVAVGFVQPDDSTVIVVTTQPSFTTSGFRNIDVDPLDGPIVYTTVSDAHLSALFIGEAHLGPLGISAPSVVFVEDVSVGIWIVGEPHLSPIAVGEPHVGMIVSEPAI